MKIIINVAQDNNIHSLCSKITISCPKFKLKSGAWFNIKMPSYQYRKSHCEDKTILRPSYLHNGIFYTGKMTSLYWIRDQGAVSIRKTVLPGVAIPMLKIRRPNGRLIFNIGIAIPRKDGLNIETGPWLLLLLTDIITYPWLNPETSLDNLLWKVAPGPPFTNMV